MARKLQRARSWYAARVSLDRTQMQVDDNLVNLGLGKAVTVEIPARAQCAQLSSTTHCASGKRARGAENTVPYATRVVPSPQD